MDSDNLISSLFGSTENIWEAIKGYAIKGSREVTRMMLQMYFCLTSPQTPALDKAIIVGGLAYQLLSKDLLPMKKYNLLGLLDNGLTLAIAYQKIQKNITPEVNAQVEATLGKWFPA
ncbi:MAG: hypothetical protein J5674_01510 [Candidatus Methanomethylophilaceae archaeon]|nr:hypothetical protein [Candidatus Methanomethylophilaceae archaeon]